MAPRLSRFKRAFAQTWVDPAAPVEIVHRQLRNSVRKTAREGNCRVVYYMPPKRRWSSEVLGDIVRVEALVKEAPNADGD